MEGGKPEKNPRSTGEINYDNSIHISPQVWESTRGSTLMVTHPATDPIRPGLTWNSVMKGNVLTAYATRWFLTFSLKCLCSSTFHLFTSRLRLVCWLILKLANNLPIFASYYASYYAFVIDSLTWLAYFLSHDYLSVTWLSLSLGFLFIFCFSMTKSQHSKH